CSCTKSCELLLQGFEPVLDEFGINVFSGTHRNDFNVREFLREIVREFHSRFVAIGKNEYRLVTEERLGEMVFPGLDTGHTNCRNSADRRGNRVNFSLGNGDGVVIIDQCQSIKKPWRIARRRHIFTVSRVFAARLNAPEPHRDNGPETVWRAPKIWNGQHSPVHFMSREWVGHVPETKLADRRIAWLKPPTGQILFCRTSGETFPILAGSVLQEFLLYVGELRHMNIPPFFE